MTGPLPTGRLRNLARDPGRPDGELRQDGHRCELCSEALPDAHRHLLRLPARQLACACRACALLFDHRSVGTGRYRAVPELRKRLAHAPVDDVVWAALGVPVRLAFFVRHDDGDPADSADSADPADTVTAYYPSPLGVVGTAVERQAWERLTRGLPSTARLEPEVAALLVYRDAEEQWLVGVDECYRLTARVRRTWTGMTGGDEVWREIDRFFTELRGDAVPA